MKQKTSEKKTEALAQLAPASAPKSELVSALALGATVLIGVFITIRPLSQFTPYAGEAAIAGMVAVMILLCVGLGLIVRRDDHKLAQTEMSALLPMMALWVGLFLLGTIRSPNLGIGIPAATNACIYGGLLLASFWLARLEPRLAGIVTRVLIAMMAVEAFSGIWQYKVDLPNLRNLVATKQIELPADLQSGAGIARLGGDRIFATFGNPNSLAGYLLVGIFALAGIVVESRRRVTTIAGIALLALLGAALVLTGSKGGMLACAAGAWFFAAQQLADRYPASRRRLIVVTIVAAVLGLGILAIGFFGFLGPRPFGSSLEVRFDYWRSALQMWREHPLTGVGLGGFSENYLYYKLPLGTEVKDTHNDYLQLATELGIMGPVAYAVLWWLMLKPGAAVKPVSATVVDSVELRRAAMLEFCAVLGGILGLGLIMAFGAGDMIHLVSGKFDRETFLGVVQALAVPTIFVCAVIALRPAADSRAATPGWIHGVRAGIGAVMVHQLVDFDFRCEATMTAIFVLGGMLRGMSVPSAIPNGAEEARTGRPHMARTAGIVLAALAIVLIPTAAWIPLQSGSARVNAEGSEHDAQELLRKFSKGGSTNDERLEYEKLRREAVDERKKARDTAPFDPDTWSDLAMAYEYSPDASLPSTFKTAQACLQRNAQLRPLSPLPQWMLGNFYMHHGMQPLENPQHTSTAQPDRELLQEARKSFAAAAERYPYCPGIRLWEGDAVLFLGDTNEAGRLYARALFIDTQIEDPNVRLSAIFNDPRPGAFARHNMDPWILKLIEGTLATDNPNPPPDVARIQSGLLLRRMVALAWTIRQNEISHRLDAGTLEQKRVDLIHTGEMLVEATPEMSDHAHAAWLWALSFQMASEKDAPRAEEAWEQARKLQSELAANGRPGTPPYTFASMEHK